MLLACMLACENCDVVCEGGGGGVTLVFGLMETKMLGSRDSGPREQ